MSILNKLSFLQLFAICILLLLASYYILKTYTTKIKNNVIRWLALLLGTLFLASILPTTVELIFDYNSRYSFTQNLAASLGSSMGTLVIPFCFLTGLYLIRVLIKTIFQISSNESELKI